MYIVMKSVFSLINKKLGSHFLPFHSQAHTDLLILPIETCWLEWSLKVWKKKQQQQTS